MAVIDASIVLAAFSPDEADELGLNRLRMCLAGSPIAPCQWLLEVTNALAVKSRRKILLPEEAETAFAAVMLLPVVQHPAPDRSRLLAIWRLSIRYRLSTYDAAYLELAIASKSPLATLDRALAAAANSAGVEVI